MLKWITLYDMYICVYIVIASLSFGVRQLM